MKIASLDLGSNTFLLLICEVIKGKVSKIIHDEISYVRLSEGLAPEGTGKKRIALPAMTRAKEALQHFALIIQQHRPDRVLAMGTSALRDAENRNELVDYAKELSIPIEIIPGSQEAEITNSGAFSNMDLELNTGKSFLVVDIGGGSTELIISQILKKPGGAAQVKIVASKSYDVGCVRLKERYQVQLPTNNENLFQIEQELKSAMADFQMNHIEYFRNGLDCVLAVAGTPTTVAMAEYKTQNIAEIEGRTLNQAQLQNWLLKTRRMGREELIGLGIPAGRVDVIVVGIVTLLTVLKTLNKDDLMVSTRGVRHGIAILAESRTST
jgi:exopolyphosphatase / guanosine-5'-triphosphate,3'-diphosphate pyrophosphatase